MLQIHCCLVVVKFRACSVLYIKGLIQTHCKQQAKVSQRLILIGVTARYVASGWVMTGCSSPQQGFNFATYSSFRCAYGNSLFLQLICTVRLLNTWNTFGCLALKIYCSPEGTRLPIRICFHSWFLNTNCTRLKLIFMCWFVMLITLTLTSLFEKLQLFLPDGFLPCDLCKTCSGVPRLRLKGDVDWFNV